VIIKVSQPKDRAVSSILDRIASLTFFNTVRYTKRMRWASAGGLCLTPPGRPGTALLIEVHRLRAMQVIGVVGPPACDPMRNNDQRCYKQVAWEMCTCPTDGPKQRLPQGKGQAPVHAIAFLAVYVDASDGRTGSFGLARTLIIAGRLTRFDTGQSSSSSSLAGLRAPVLQSRPATPQNARAEERPACGREPGQRTCWRRTCKKGPSGA
jgi:hypothetical protein